MRPYPESYDKHSEMKRSTMHPRRVARWAALFLLPLATRGEPVTLPLEHSAMIGDGVAAFYPEGVDGRTLPSLALLSAPVEQGPLADGWNLSPAFALEGDQVVATVDLPEGTDLYGTGEVTGPLRRNGRTVELWATDNFTYEKHEGKRLYQSHPWVLGVRADGSAFGVLFDTTWRSTLSLGKKAIRFASEGPPFRVLVIDRATPQAVVSELGRLTGTMPLPPRWSLGFQQCKWSYYPDAQAREIADQFRARNLPCDVLWFDIHYMDGYRIFTFDPERYPDPSATNAYLHNLGFKSVWMIDPGVKEEQGYSVFDSGTAQDVWVQTAAGEPFTGEVWPGMCRFPDFTMPRTRAWWGGLYQDFMATGIDGVWNDMNEPAVFSYQLDGTMPLDNQHRGGGELPPGSHLRYHNTYGMLMVKASREGILAANPGKRPFLLTRSNFLGGQRYAATWTGDNAARWEHLEMSVPMVINLGLSGQPFVGPDIGGFAEEGNGMLFGHWIAVGAFYPFSRAHNARDLGDKEPWAFGPEIEHVAQTALFRRYRLLPYLYTQMEHASRTGLPVMQPVFFADPADRSLRREQSLFLFGPDLLIEPLWAAAPRLPKGKWRPVRLLDGEREDDGFQPIVHLRDGAIVPLGEVVQNTSEESLAPLTLLVSLDAEGRAEGELYEDSGDGFAYREGDFARSHYRAERVEEGVRVVLVGREGERAVHRRWSRVVVVTDEGTFRDVGDLVSGVTVRVSP